MNPKNEPAEAQAELSQCYCLENVGSRQVFKSALFTYSPIQRLSVQQFATKIQANQVVTEAFLFLELFLRPW